MALTAAGAVVPPIVTHSLYAHPYELTRSYFYDPAYWYEENWNNENIDLSFHRWLAISASVNWSAAANDYSKYFNEYTLNFLIYIGGSYSSKADNMERVGQVGC